MKKLLLLVAVAFSATAFAQSVLTPVVDEAEYNLGGKGEFENLWIISRNTDNFPTEGSFEVGGNSRGMAVVQAGDDYLTAKVLITRRTSEGKVIEATETSKAIKKDNKLELIVINGLSGEFEGLIELPDEAFTFEDGDTLRQCGLALNDLHVDNAGNLVAFNLLTGYGSGLETAAIRAWGIDIDWENKTATTEEIFTHNETIGTGTIRIDYFGVYGDLKNEGYVMATNQTTPDVIKLVVEEGEFIGESDWVTIKEMVPYSETAFGSASRIFPISEDNFYADGFSTLATLYDMNGNYVDGFKDAKGDLADYVKLLNYGHNGVCEAAIGESTYMLHAARNTIPTDGIGASSFGIVELDIDGSRGGSQPVVLFPKKGMGDTTNQERTALIRSIVAEGSAYIWAYTGCNGLACYKFTPSEHTAVKNIEGNTLRAFVSNGKINLTEEVANVEVYSVLGQKVAEAHNTNVVEVAGKGIFVVKAGNMSQKVVLK